MDINLWKLDFLHMIFIKERKKGKYVINKGDYTMYYNFSPYVLFYSVTFKKNNIIHRDDDKPSVIVYFYNFDIKSNNYYKEGSPYREIKAVMINYNLKGEVINKIYITHSNKNFITKSNNGKKIIINKKLIK